MFAHIFCFVLFLVKLEALPTYNNYDKSDAVDFTLWLEAVKDELTKVDPTFVESIPLQFDNNVLIGNMTITNMTFKGFSNFQVNRATVSSDHMDIELLFEELKADYHYKGYGLFYTFIPMYGDGLSDILMSGARLGMASEIIIKGMDDPIVIEKLKFHLGLVDCKIHITGLLDSDELGAITSMALTDFIMLSINEDIAWINKLVAPLVQEKLNKLIVDNNITPNVLTGNKRKEQ